MITPVVRFYGITKEGYSVCMNAHNFLPYISTIPVLCMSFTETFIYPNIRCMKSLIEKIGLNTCQIDFEVLARQRGVSSMWSLLNVAAFTITKKRTNHL